MDLYSLPFHMSDASTVLNVQSNKWRAKTSRANSQVRRHFEFKHEHTLTVITLPLNSKLINSNSLKTFDVSMRNAIFTGRKSMV